MTSSKDEPKKLGDLLDDIDQEVEGADDFAVRDVLDAFGTRAFGPLIAVPALIVMTPVGAVPGVPAILGLFIVLIAGQHVFGRKHPWIPKQILNRSVSSNKWEKASKKAEPWAERIDKVIKPRLTWLVGGAMERVIGILAIALSVMMVPLELIPFAVALPGLALLMLGLAISARDGVLMIVGLAATLASGYLVTIALG